MLNRHNISNNQWIHNNHKISFTDYIKARDYLVNYLAVMNIFYVVSSIWSKYFEDHFDNDEEVRYFFTNCNIMMFILSLIAILILAFLQPMLWFHQRGYNKLAALIIVYCSIIGISSYLVITDNRNY